MQRPSDGRIHASERDSANQEIALTVCVVTEPDPGALLRVLERFRNINIMPLRTLAEVEPSGILRIRLELAEMDVDRLALITARIQNVPSVLDATWCRAEL